MGASDSKLVFKQGIFKLSEQKNIPANDQYWTGVCDNLYAQLSIEADALLVLGASRVC